MDLDLLFVQGTEFFILLGKPLLHACIKVMHFPVEYKQNAVQECTTADEG